VQILVVVATIQRNYQIHTFYFEDWSGESFLDNSNWSRVSRS